MPCDFEGKIDFINLMLREYGLSPRDWMFVGDGMNDVTIAEKSPLSIGYCAHQKLRLPFFHMNSPRFQGKAFYRDSPLQAAPQFAPGRMEVKLVGYDLVPFVPKACDTFQTYLRHTEDYPNDASVRQIVVASEGRELPGLSAEVRQVVSLRDFASEFYEVEDAGLSEDALRWMCVRGKEGAGKTLSDTFKALFFPEGGIVENVLCVFDGHKGVEREAVLWLVKQVAPRGSYLECVARYEEVLVDNFRSTYVTTTAERLDESTDYARERKDAIQAADVRMSDADIRQFIARCMGESTSRVAPWLNCETDAERAELLRRCVVDGIVSKAVKVVYPEAADYLNMELVFGDETLEEYFREYRELKMAGQVTPEFCGKAVQVDLPSSVQSRDTIVQRYVSDNECALLVVDGMGAEWLPMLVALARKRNTRVDFVIGKAHLPTSTEFNSIHWPDAERRLPDIKRFDNIAHNGAEAHETRSVDENLAEALDVIGAKV
jgi:hypothetical protein